MYFPLARCTGALRDIYLFGKEPHEATHIEVVNREALILYGRSDDMWRNSRIIRHFCKLQAERKEMAGGKKRVNSKQW